jgi:crotonobetainyl-CoA:carnitine CoA-transferase CaiB-like acyl-CoA transferase
MAAVNMDQDRNPAAFSVSLFDGLSEWMTQPALYGHYSGADPRRAGASHASIAPYGPFTTSDGAEVNLGVQNEREWRALCADVVDQPGLGDDPRFATNPERVAHRTELVSSWTAASPRWGRSPRSVSTTPRCGRAWRRPARDRARY